MPEPGSPEIAEVSPKKGLTTGYKEARLRLLKAEHQAVKESELQRGELWNWAREQEKNMPAVINDKRFYSKKREGVWSVEGRGEKSVKFYYAKYRDEGEEREILRRIEIEDATRKEELDIEGSRWSLEAGGVRQDVSFYRSQAGGVRYRQYRGRDKTVPDVLDYSRETLDFLKQARMQPAAPSQPSSGQPTK